MNFFPLLTALTLLLKFDGETQSFYNGSFENTTATACTKTLSNNQFNGKLTHVTAFGNFYNGINKPLGKTSLHDSDCCVIPQHGNWCIGLRASFNPSFDAVALELTTPLDSGQLYYISFYVYGNLSFRNFMLNVDVGESLVDTNFGTQIHTVTPDLLIWKNVSFAFTASQFSNYITLKTTSGYGSWHQVDNFVISRLPILLSVEEQFASNTISFYPNPASDFMTLRFANAPTETHLEIINELGEVAFQKQEFLSRETSIDLRDFPAGVYCLRMMNSNKSIYKKIIIER